MLNFYERNVYGGIEPAINVITLIWMEECSKSLLKYLAPVTEARTSARKDMHRCHVTVMFCPNNERV